MSVAPPKIGNAGATLRQVAKRSGVSASTVSRILNGTAHVSPAKHDAVQAAIEALGFRPNPVARGLAGGRTLTIGVATPSISSPFYGEAMRSIELHLERAGYVPLFVSGSGHAADEHKAIQTLLTRRVDGIIVLAGHLPSAELLDFACGAPLVLVGRELEGPQLFSFRFDNRQGARLATRHLLELGHRRIAFLAGELALEDAVLRQCGYIDALREAGIEPDPALLLQGDFTERSGIQAVERLLASSAPFTALFASNDQMALGAALALHRKGRRIPQDVSLVGFDDLALAEYLMPPLTTVRQPAFEIGEQAAQAMLMLLRGEQAQAALPAPRLIVRESTRALAAAKA